YSYKLGERTALNLSYIFNYFTFSDSTPRGVLGSSITPANLARNHLAYVGIRQQLTPSVSVFANVGPSITIGDSFDTGQGLRIHPGVRPSIDAGILLGQSIDPRTFFSLSISQSTSDGMGLGTAAELQTAGVSLGRRLSKSISTAITANYNHNRFLTDFESSGQPITTNGVTIGSNLRIGLTDRLFLNASYRYYHQVSSGFVAAIPGNLSGNIALVGLSYSIPVFF